jgi:hypothetical protein
MIENPLYLQGGAGTVSMDQAVAEVIQLEVEASANARRHLRALGAYRKSNRSTEPHYF